VRASFRTLVGIELPVSQQPILAQLWGIVVRRLLKWQAHFLKKDSVTRVAADVVHAFVLSLKSLQSGLNSLPCRSNGANGERRGFERRQFQARTTSPGSQRWASALSDLSRVNTLSRASKTSPRAARTVL